MKKLRIYLIESALSVYPYLIISGIFLYFLYRKDDSMYIWGIIWVLYTVFLIMVLLKIICTVRLNDYFIVRKYPFCGWYIVSQSVNKKHVKNMTCKEIARDLNQQTNLAFEHLKPNCLYITSTHDTVAYRLEKNPNIHIVAKFDDGKHSLEKIQKHLFFKNCNTCCDSEKERCILLKTAKPKRNFYFVKFKVKS